MSNTVIYIKPSVTQQNRWCALPTLSLASEEDGFVTLGGPSCQRCVGPSPAVPWALTALEGQRGLVYISPNSRVLCLSHLASVPRALSPLKMWGWFPSAETVLLEVQNVNYTKYTAAQKQLTFQQPSPPCFPTPSTSCPFSCILGVPSHTPRVTTSALNNGVPEHEACPFDAGLRPPELLGLRGSGDTWAGHGWLAGSWQPAMCAL